MSTAMSAVVAAGGAAAGGAGVGASTEAVPDPAPAPATMATSIWRRPRVYSRRRSMEGMFSLTSSCASKSRSQAWKSGNASASTSYTLVTSSKTANQ
ncbi:hypothetical protein ZWY2020_037627 [Hordeum vulgare]|nr:hypothetical protein ZWY2020_037627 [Hordeum vulgare]